MRLSNIPYNRSHASHYPYEKLNVSKGLIVVNDITKQAVKTKLEVAAYRADRLDNSRFDSNPEKGIVDAYIPEFKDSFKFHTDKNGVKHYEESSTTKKKGLFKNEETVITDSLSLSPDGEVSVSETKDSKSRGSFLTGLIVREDDFNTKQSFKFNLSDV